MKKTLLIGLLAFTFTNCSKDDNNDFNPVDKIDTDTTILLGNWETVEYLYMDANNNIIQEVRASENNGCGKDNLEINKDYFFYKMPTKVENECISESYSFQYKIEDKKIINLTEQTYNVTQEVVVVNEAWLSIRESGDDVDYRVFKGELPSNTKYVRTEYKKLN